ncbi:MAG: TolC family protein [Bacteroidales bacterium]
MKRKYIIYSVLLSLFFSTSLLSQESKLSLNDAIQLGLENNFKIRLSKLNLNIAQNNNTQGNAGRYPNLQLEGSNVNSWTDIVGSSTASQKIKTNRSAFESGMGLNWVLFNGFAVSIQKKTFDNLEMLSEGQSALVVENNLRAIILAYYQVLLQQERLKIFSNVKKLSADRLKVQEEQKNLGVSVTFDVLQGKDAFLADSIQYLKQELNLRKSMQLLNILLGDTPGRKYLLVDSLRTDFPDFDQQDLLQQALSDNKQLINLYTELKLKELSVRRSKSNLWPRLQFNGGGKTSNEYLNFPETDNNTHKEGLNYYANFSLSFNLFNGGKTRIAIRNARIQEDIASLNIDEMKYSVENEVYTQFDLYEIRKKLVKTAKLSKATSELNLQMAQELYNNGSINSFNYRDVQLLYLRASLESFQAIYDAIESQLDIMKLKGDVLSYK